VIILTAKYPSQNPLELVPNVRIYMTKPFDPPELLDKVKGFLPNDSKSAHTVIPESRTN